VRNLDEQMDLFSPLEPVPINPITGDPELTAPFDAELLAKSKEAVKTLPRDVAVGALTSIPVGAGDTVDLGSAFIPSYKDVVEGKTQGAMPSTAVLTLGSIFDTLSDAGISRDNAEKLIKEVTGIELKGNPGEFIGEVIGLPAAGLANAGKSIISAVAKHGNKFDDVVAEAKSLFRTASGGDDFDGMAPATVTDTPPVAAQTDQVFDTAPKLPDTSVSPNMIGESTAIGQEAIADYERVISQGMSKEDAYKNTGVYVGADGKHRYDLLPIRANLKEEFQPDGLPLSPENYTGETYDLDEVLDFESLFTAYEDEYYDAYALDFVTPSSLRDIKVTFEDADDFLGRYSYQNDAITLDTELLQNPDKLLSVLMHEVQHAVQRREGFTSGSNEVAFFNRAGMDLDGSAPVPDLESRDELFQFQKAEIEGRSRAAATAESRIEEFFDQSDKFVLTDNDKDSLFFIAQLISDVNKKSGAKYIDLTRHSSDNYDVETIIQMVKSGSDLTDDLEVKDRVNTVLGFLDKIKSSAKSNTKANTIMQYALQDVVIADYMFDLSTQISDQAALLYRRKYGELEAKLVEERLGAIRKMQAQGVDSDEIARVMRKRYPPVNMVIRDQIIKSAGASKEGMSGSFPSNVPDGGMVRFVPEDYGLLEGAEAGMPPGLMPPGGITSAAGKEAIPTRPLEIGVSPLSEGGKLLKGYDSSTLSNLNAAASNATVSSGKQLVGRVVEDGTKVGIRLNLNSKIPNMPAGLNKLQTVHAKNYNGKALSYQPSVTVENVVFNVNQKGRAAVAAKSKGSTADEAKSKYNLASVDGTLTSQRNVLEEMDDTVVEIGFNPAVTHLYVDMATGQAVESAEVATVIGDRVYAKGVKYLKKADAPEASNPDMFKFVDGTDIPSEVRYKMKKGGVVPMDRQMDMFQEGGLEQDGGTKDPISGNDVPPGSTQEEVRDDIPAQLSEGEFVFPADVVRYIGLEKLMQMRQEAKMGLAMMERMGQMGNSEEAVMPDDIPFELSDLDITDEPEYNVGGFVPANQQQQQFGIAGYTPAAAPTTAAATAPVQAASQQFVAPELRPVQAAVPTMGATTDLPEFTEFTGGSFGAPDEYRTYRNDAGQEVRIAFKNGQPLQPIPEGYKYVDPEAVETEEVTTTPTTVETATVREDTSDDDERRRKEEEARFGPGGGRIGIQGNVYGVSFDMPEGFMPGMAGAGATALSLLSGKPLPENVSVNIKRDDLEVKLSGVEYNKLKQVIKDEGANSDAAGQAFEEIVTNALKREELTYDDGSSVIEQITKSKSGEENYSQSTRDNLAELRADQARRAEEAAQRRAEEAYRESQRDDDPSPAGEPTQYSVGSDPYSDPQEIASREDRFGEAGLYMARGGLAGKKKPKAKKMKRGGLASKK